VLQRNKRESRDFEAEQSRLALIDRDSAARVPSDQGLQTPIRGLFQTMSLYSNLEGPEEACFGRVFFA
jgi:hypothetical protein